MKHRKSKLSGSSDLSRRDALKLSAAAGIALPAGAGVLNMFGSSPAAAAEMSGSVEFWHLSNPAPAAVYTSSVERMRVAHPGVELRAQSIQNDPYKTKLQVAMGADQPPDVFHSFGGGGVLKAFVDAGKVMDLTDVLAEERFKDRFAPASAFDNMTWDGRTYAVPILVAGAFFYYDRDLFQRLGIKQWRTWDEFLAELNKMKENGLIPIALANKARWAGAFYYNYLVGRIAGFDFLPKVLSGEAKFDAPEVVRAGELLQDLARLDPFPKGFNGLAYDTGESRQLLYSGKAGMEMITNYFPGTAAREAPEYAKRIWFTPFPIIPGGADDGSGVIGGVSAAFAVSSGAEHPDAAIELLDFLTDATARDEFAEAGIVVALKGANPPDPLMKEHAKAFENAKSYQLYWDQFLPPALGQAQLDVSQSLLDFTTTPQAAAEHMAAVAKTEL